MRAPAISVVMGVHNGGPELAATLDSVLSQQGVDLEFVVVDDGSKDTTAAVLAERAARDPRLRVLTQPNAGLTRALIRGCAEARAEVIARQDAGDLSAPGRLAAQLTLLVDDPGLAFVSCWTQFVGPADEPLYEARGRGRAERPAMILSDEETHGVIDGPTHHASVVFRRSSYERAGGYRAEFYWGQDWDLWYRLATTGAFQMLPRVLYRARVSPGSISLSRRGPQGRLAALSREALRLRRQGRPDAPVLREAAAIRPASGRERAVSEAAGLYFIGESLRRRGDARAGEYLARAVRANPAHLKAWLRLIQQRFAAGGWPGRAS